MDTARLELRKAGADEALLQVSAEVRRLQRASRLEQGRVRRVLDRVSEVACIFVCGHARMQRWHWPMSPIKKFGASCTFPR